jgi:hypothetical protein
MNGQTVPQSAAAVANFDCSRFWRLGTLAPKFHFEQAMLAFHWLELHREVSRLAAALQVRSDSEHAGISSLADYCRGPSVQHFGAFLNGPQPFPHYFSFPSSGIGLVRVQTRL